MNVFIAQLIDENSDRIETFVRLNISRSHAFVSYVEERSWRSRMERKNGEIKLTILSARTDKQWIAMIMFIDVTMNVLLAPHAFVV